MVSYIAIALRLTGGRFLCRIKLKPSGYVKLHRSLLANPLFQRDPQAAFVFMTLLMLVDRNTGVYIGGRYRLAALTGLKPMTCYRKLKRLQSETMVKLKCNARFTEITLINWDKYQQGETQVKRKTNASETQMYTKQEVRSKTKELNKDNVVETQAGIRLVYDHFIKQFDKNPSLYKLTDKRKLKIKARLKDAGKDLLLKAIDNVAASPWHMGDNDRGWTADLDYIVRSYEQVEKWGSEAKGKVTFKADW